MEQQHQLPRTRGAGTLIGQVAKAFALAGDVRSAHAYASGQGVRWSEAANALKASVDAIGTGGSNAIALTQPVGYDLAEALRAATVLGRLQGVTRVPFNTRTLTAGVGATASWVAEAKPIPVQALDLDVGTTLAPLKIASISVTTKELLRSSNPSAEGVIGRDLVAAAALAADTALLDPANEGVVDKKPASVFLNCPTLNSTGTAAANIDADLRRALNAIVAQGVPLDSAAWIMAPETAVYLSLLRSGDAQAYSGMTAKGGTLAGSPALTSAAMGASADSPSEAAIALIVASEILLADDGEAELDTSEAGALEMDSAPTGGARQLVALWQNNLAAIRVIRTVSWQLRRGLGAVLVSGLNL